ncbi:MAG TPA: XdhC family protein [Chloroflexota bacterium]|nr:XdhC family protein [Chloroflexota bacterium]
MSPTGDLAWLLDQANERIARGERVAMVTVVRTRGSTPRKVGTKMLVFEDGLFAGTVGGGCGEADVLQETLRAMESGEPTLFHVDLTADEAEESGDVCGGIMDVFIEPRLPVDESPRN